MHNTIIVFDLDGTLADCDQRLHHLMKKPKDWRAFFDDCDKDKPISSVIWTLKTLALSQVFPIEIWTGRSDAVRSKTQDWLNKHGMIEGVHYQRLRMRQSGNHTPDHILKREWLDELKAKQGAILCVFEDRTRVVRMWRDQGIVCYQVDDGNF